MDQSRFIRGLLDDRSDPQMPQYDPQAGLDTALEIGSHVPPMPWIVAMGAYPDGHGGLRPGLIEQIEKGRYSDAARDALYLAGGVAASRYFMPRFLPGLLSASGKPPIDGKKQ